MKTKIQQKNLQALTNQFEPVSIETLEGLIERGLFHLLDSEHWRFGDEYNGTTRRLDGRKFNRPDTKGADWHKLIGLSYVVANDRKHVVFNTEGSKDAIAAAEFNPRGRQREREADRYRQCATANEPEDRTAEAAECHLDLRLAT